jgi:hypothetical protein
MSDQKTLVPEWVTARLRGLQPVISAATRLSGQQDLGAEKVRTLALDPSGNIDTRVDAATLLVASEIPERRVLEALFDSNDDVLVIETLKRIREIGPEWVVSDLISRARTSGAPSTRAVFAWALASYPNNADALDTLLYLMTQDSDVTVQSHAIESLSEFRSPAVLDALLSALKTGSASERFWSLFSLGTIADVRAVEAVRACLEDNTIIPDYGTVSSEAKWALERITGHSHT